MPWLIMCRGEELEILWKPICSVVLKALGGDTLDLLCTCLTLSDPASSLQLLAVS